MNRGTRRGRGARRGSLRNFQQRLIAVKHQLNGRRLRLNPNPPMITAEVWNTIIVSAKEEATTTAQICKVDDIMTKLKDQLGLPGKSTEPPTLLIRVKWVKLWCLSRSYALQAAFYDLNKDTDQWYLDTLEDWPAGNAFACVGYEWPRSMQERVLHTAATEVFTYVTSVAGAVLQQIFVEWKVGEIKSPRLRGFSIDHDFSELSLT